jgi:hypothetical protein
MGDHTPVQNGRKSSTHLKVALVAGDDGAKYRSAPTGDTAMCGRKTILFLCRTAARMISATFSHSVTAVTSLRTTRGGGMLDRTEVRRYAVEWVEQRPKGFVFHLSDLYRYLQAKFPTECDEQGFTPDGEPKWQKDARWAIQDCKHRKLIRHTGYSEKSGKWERL